MTTPLVLVTLKLESIACQVVSLLGKWSHRQALSTFPAAFSRETVIMPPLVDTITGGKDGAGTTKIKDASNVESLIAKFAKGGSQNLLVIMDFDMTISRLYDKDGKKCDTCHGAIRCSQLMPDEFRTKADELFRKYYPIEMDDDLTVEEKIPHMMSWYTEAHENLASCSLKKDDLKEIAENSKIRLRDGTEELFQLLNKHQIPLVIYSAGVGDILEHVLQKYNCRFPNITIVSNFVEFKSDGSLVGFKDPLIFMYNKTWDTLRQSLPDYLKIVQDRKNVMLFGDSLGDLDMVKGLNDVENILKVGFVNVNIDKRQESFMKAFDIVLVNDQSMTVPSSIVDVILKQ